jgi:hypothetical protein
VLLSFFVGLSRLFAQISKLALDHHSRFLNSLWIIILDSFQASILVNAASAYLNGGVDGQRWGTAHPSIVPYQAFATADGHILVAAGNDGQFRRLCARMRAALSADNQSAAQTPLLADDPRYASNAARVKNRQGAAPHWFAFSSMNLSRSHLSACMRNTSDRHVALFLSPWPDTRTDCGAAD